MAKTNQHMWHKLDIPNLGHPIDGLRVLVRPLIPPTQGKVRVVNEGVEEITLQAPGASELTSFSVLGLLQRKDDIKIVLRVILYPRSTFVIDLYYEPSGDQLVFTNRSASDVAIERLDTTQDSGRTEARTKIPPQGSCMVGFGLWSLVLQTIPVLEWTVLPRSGVTIKGKDISNDHASIDNTELTRKRPANSLASLHEGETLYLPKVGDEKAYQVTIREKIAGTPASEVFTALHSGLGECVVVKLLKSAPPGNDGGRIRQQSETWLREYTIHRDMKDVSFFSYPVINVLTVFRNGSSNSRIGTQDISCCT